MRKTYFFIILFILITTVIGSPVYAEDASKQETIGNLRAQGNQAFKQGAYERALSLFVQAKEHGGKSVSLFYNIGVCSYKTGAYSQARAAFTEVAKDRDMAPLAFYNLGLVALKEENQSEAGKWFRKTIETATNVKLKNLAETALDQLKKDAASPWFGFFSLGLGYDDNVKTVYDGDTQTTTGQGDAFSEIMLFTKGPLLKESNRFSMQWHVYALSFEDLHESNYTSTTLALIYGQKLGSNAVEAGVDYDYSFVGSDEYAQVPSAYAQFEKQFRQFYIRLKYRFSYLDILDSNYDYLTGTRNRISAETGQQRGDLRARIRYTLELNDREQDDSSPTRHQLGLKLYLKLSKQVKLSAGSSFRRSEYEIQGNRDRDENLWKFSIRSSYAFTKKWTVSAEYRHDKNDSNYSSYDYTRNTGLMNITLSF